MNKWHFMKNSEVKEIQETENINKLIKHMDMKMKISGIDRAPTQAC